MLEIETDRQTDRQRRMLEIDDIYKKKDNRDNLQVVFRFWKRINFIRKIFKFVIRCRFIQILERGKTGRKKKIKERKEIKQRITKNSITTII